MTEILYTPRPSDSPKENTEKHEGRITTRNAVREDIPTLVDVDIKSFSSVYSGYEQTEEELRTELTDKFYHRFDLVGPRWMKVAERDGNIVGFMMACPTSKDPMNFTSWEDATDNGKLTNTYDPEGKNLYIVSLSMLRAGSADLGQNMLFGNMMGDFIKEDFDLAYFESRVPGLRTWVKKECKLRDIDFDSLSPEDLDVFAKEYFNLKKVNKDGKEVPQDRLLQIYDSAGCKFIDIYRDAYQDLPSLNYGVLGIFDNPLSERLRKSNIVRNVASFAISQAAKSNYLMTKVF